MLERVDVGISGTTRAVRLAPFVPLLLPASALVRGALRAGASAADRAARAPELGMRHDGPPLDGREAVRAVAERC